MSELRGHSSWLAWALPCALLACSTPRGPGPAQVQAAHADVGGALDVSALAPDVVPVLAAQDAALTLAGDALLPAADVAPLAPDVPPSAPDVPPPAPDVLVLAADVPPPAPDDVPTSAPDVPPPAPDVEPLAPDVPPSAPDVETIALDVALLAPDLPPPAPDVALLAADVPPPAPDLPPPAPDVAQLAPDVALLAPDVPPPAPDVALLALDVPAPAPDVPAPTADVAPLVPDIAAIAADVATKVADVPPPAPDVPPPAPPLPIDPCAGVVCATTLDTACAKAACVKGICQLQGQAGACDDGNACTLGDACIAGKCAAGATTDCADADPCTADTCDPKTAVCSHDPAALAGKPCGFTTGNCPIVQTCVQGQCKAYSKLACDDANPCTADTCDAAGLCSHTPADGKVCDDGQYCTASDTCLAGKCISGAAKSCDDTSACTLDSCTAATGACFHAALPGCGKRLQMAMGGKKGDRFNAVALVPDGGYLLAGSTMSWTSGDKDVFVVRADACGSPLWTLAWGGKAMDQLHTAIAAKDGGFLVAGASISESGVIVIKLDAQGKVVWANVYGGGIYEFARAAVETQDGHFILAGETRSSAVNHALQLFEIDQDGKLLWMIDVGGAVEGDAAFGLTEVIGADGSSQGVMAVGGVESWGSGNDDIWLLRVDGDGKILWSAAYGSSGDDEARDVAQLPDGKGFVVTGKTDGFGVADQDEDIVVLEVGPNGDVHWMRRYGGAGFENGENVFWTADGLAVTGWSPSWAGQAAYLLQTDATGEPTSLHTYGGGNAQYGFGAAKAPDGGFAIVGSTWSAGAGGGDAYLVRTDPQGDAGCASDVVSVSKAGGQKVKPNVKFFSPKAVSKGTQHPAKGTWITPVMTPSFATVVCPCQ